MKTDVLIAGAGPVGLTMASELARFGIRLRIVDKAAHSGPKAGERAPIREGEPAVGSGNTPRFALFAEDTPASRLLLSKYPNLVEPSPRKQYADGGIWIVRPDGYVALATKHDTWNDVDAYLSRLAKAAAAAAH